MSETEKYLEDVWVDTTWGSMHSQLTTNFDPSGPVYVLVHGLLVSGDYMQPTAERLARKNMVVVPDMLGHGGSSNPPKTLSIAEHAKSIAQTLESLAVKYPVLVGGSYGCNVAIDLASRDDVNAEGLILIGPADTSEGHAPTMIQRLLADTFIEPPRIVPMVMSDITRIGLGRIFEQLGYMFEHDFHGKMKNLRIPTLLIVGDKDPMATDDFLCATTVCAPYCKQITVPSAAHALPYSRPELMASLITQWIEGDERDELQQAG